MSVKHFYGYYDFVAKSIIQIFPCENSDVALRSARYLVSHSNIQDLERLQDIALVFITAINEETLVPVKVKGSLEPIYFKDLIKEAGLDVKIEAYKQNLLYRHAQANAQPPMPKEEVKDGE